MERLQEGREKINRDHAALYAKVEDGELLSPMEERKYVSIKFPML